MLVEEKLKVVRNYLASKHGHEVDRWGHIKYEQNGREYRFKFMTNVIRREVRVKYDDGSKSWMRLKSYNVSDAYKNLKSKKLI